jgi:hypothetical protein
MPMTARISQRWSRFAVTEGLVVWDTCGLLGHVWAVRFVTAMTNDDQGM